MKCCISRQGRSVIPGVGPKHCIFLSSKRLLLSTGTEKCIGKRKSHTWHWYDETQRVQEWVIFYTEMKQNYCSIIPTLKRGCGTSILRGDQGTAEQEQTLTQLDSLRRHRTAQPAQVLLNWHLYDSIQYTCGITFPNVAVLHPGLKGELHREKAMVGSAHTCWHCHSRPSHHPHGDPVPPGRRDRSRIHGCWHSIGLHDCGVVDYVGWCCI